jgi:hypothetical protein
VRQLAHRTTWWQQRAEREAPATRTMNRPATPAEPPPTLSKPIS